MKIICPVTPIWPNEAKNIKLDLSIASVSYSNMLMLQRMELQRRTTRIQWISKENQFVYKKNYPWRKRFFEILKSEACTGVNAKSQCKNKRKPWDNTEAHFPRVAGDARADEFYEWFGRISRSGIESQRKLSYVPSQLAMIPRFSFPCSARDKRLPLDTWNTSGLQEKFSVIKFLRLDSHRALAHHKEHEDQFCKLRTETLFARYDKK